MPESFHQFHGTAAAAASAILSQTFAWGAVAFDGVVAPATVEQDPPDDPGSIGAVIIKALRAQFSAAGYPRSGSVVTGQGARYRVVDDVHARPNDPFIEIPAVEIPSA